MWRYTSIADLINIAKATLVSSLVLIMVVLFLNRFAGFSRSVFIIDGVLSFLFICLHRGTIRYFFENSGLLRNLLYPGNENMKIRLLLIGAGSAAEKVIREVKDNTGVKYKVVGLIDDDLSKHGLSIHGVPVIGTIEELNECIKRTTAEELLITIASADETQMRRIIGLCQRSEKKFKVLPSMGEILKGRLSVSAIRELSYRDLLGREPVKLNQNEIGSYLSGRTVLITGAGGSIGSELCRQILKFDPEKLVLMDAGEENLYDIHMELQHDLGFLNHVPILCKIQDRNILEAAFSEYRPEVVFHAAAYKHVPLLEANPWEAVFNNVSGTRNIIEAAINHKVNRFVLVSTDKAVRPTNVMGASKRLTELIMLSYYTKMSAMKDGAESRTRFMAVRFGNVLGSSGSVIPLFKKQIEKGGPVTVTDPEITRYFMSIDEAAQLIMQAGAMGDGGEIFLLKMGKPVKIINLAHDLIKLMGYEPDVDIKISFTGLRPGEKLYEELITEGEGIVPTEHEKILVLRGPGMPYEDLDEFLIKLESSSLRCDANAMKTALKDILPEYKPDYTAHTTLNAVQ
jgi:FlaA1/EpsC-like NDP-sugar epimerase